MLLILIIIIEFALNIYLYVKISELKTDLEKQKSKCDYYKWKMSYYAKKVDDLRYEMDTLYHSASTRPRWQAKPTATNKDIVEAVKYAMKMSHPDNNGNAEDFVKFRKLYKDLTK